MNNEMNLSANREYKSTVFAHLFKEKEKLLSLYNALNHSNYVNDEELEIVTLENAIYMAMKNDLAFILDCKLNLYEHQSTPNPNMPLRDLFYVCKEYERIISKNTIYSTRKIKIPAPHFVVFYNGIDVQPEKEILKLSDLYQVHEEEPMLELKVIMLNINDGNNEDLKESCKILKEYMQYVNRVRKYVYQNNMILNNAVELAITECIREGILEDFLRKNRAEVKAMSIYEFDEEQVMNMWREELREEGLAKGLAKGLAEGRAQGLVEGRAEGRAEGEIKLSELIFRLLVENRLSDIELATKDEEVRKKLYLEFGIME